MKDVKSDGSQSVQPRPWLRARRVELGFRSQKALAGKLAVSRESVNAWEMGRAAPEGENLERLAATLDRSAEWVLAGPSPTSRNVNPAPAGGWSVREAGPAYEWSEIGFELEELRADCMPQLPAELVRTWVRTATIRASLGAMEAHAAKEKWSPECLERIRALRARVERLQQAADQAEGD